MTHFTIDFFEFSFLVEVCIPPVPIARACLWEKVINTYYHGMTEDERTRLYKWIKPRIEARRELAPEEYGFAQRQLFLDRYNPDNQYLVTAEYEGKVDTTRCFLNDGKYRTSSDTYIATECITNIQKL